MAAGRRACRPVCVGVATWLGTHPLRLLSRAGAELGIVQSGEFPEVIRDHDLSEAPCDGDHVRPGGRPEILLVGIDGRLVSSGVERDTQLTHESDLFLCPQTDAEVPFRLVRVAEVIEQRVKDVVQVLEHRRVEPYVPLPRGVGQSQDYGYDVDSVVRDEAGVLAHGGEPSDPGLRSWRRSRGAGAMQRCPTLSLGSGDL